MNIVCVRIDYKRIVIYEYYLRIIMNNGNVRVLPMTIAGYIDYKRMAIYEYSE